MTALTQNEAAAEFGCSRASIYRMAQRGELTIVSTPIGPRIMSDEIARILGARPAQSERTPDPKRQRAAARAREAKAAKAAAPPIVDELREFMAEMRERLDRIEAAMPASPDEPDAVTSYRHGPLHSPW